jgi:hypothetical protein
VPILPLFRDAEESEVKEQDGRVLLAAEANALLGQQVCVCVYKYVATCVYVSSINIHYTMVIGVIGSHVYSCGVQAAELKEKNEELVKQFPEAQGVIRRAEASVVFVATHGKQVAAQMMEAVQVCVCVCV